MLKLLQLLVLVAALTTAQSWAQITGDNEIEITALERVDHIYLDNKREEIGELSFSRLDKILRGDKRDLSALQALLDQQLIGPADEQKLLAMGVVLGDVFAAELNVEWRNYLDNIGRSRAVCMPQTTHCLFPITMISKRVTRGVKVDVEELYLKGIELLEPYKPRLPYSADKK